MGRTIVLTIFLIASIPMHRVGAQSSCPAAGTVYRDICPGEVLVDCNYDESQCEGIFNIDPTFYL
jgi:hypothetical protein